MSTSIAALVSALAVMVVSILQVSVFTQYTTKEKDLRGRGGENQK